MATVATPRPHDIAGPIRYDVDVDVAPAAPHWDAFVDRTPGGDHVQTSAWARVKQVVGWRAVRVVVRGHGEVVGGCQLLIRDLPGAGAVGYAPRGPLLADHDPHLLELLLDAVDAIASDHRLIALKLQPPPGGEWMTPVLEDRGYRASELDVAPVATVRIDLGHDEAALLSDMRSGHRANIRKAPRKGVTVRAGTLDDIPAYMDVVRATARRQGFPVYPAAYYEAMLRSFSDGDHARLVIAELDGRVLAGVMVLAYGDGAMYKMGGWSGEPRNIHPNEPAHWDAIRWARERGYRYYDFEGISPKYARALNAGLNPDPPERGDARFKLGFGGEVALLPGTYDFSYRPLRARAIQMAAGLVGRPAKLAYRLLGRTRRD